MFIIYTLFEVKHIMSIVKRICDVDPLTPRSYLTKVCNDMFLNYSNNTNSLGYGI